MTVHARELAPQDAPSLRKLRLATLRHYGDLFANLYQEKKEKPPSYWQDLCVGTRNQCFFGLFDNNKMIGVNAARQWSEQQDSQSALAWGHYLMPEYRGRGYARALYEKRINWAYEQGYTELVSYLLDGNTKPTLYWVKYGADHLFDRKMSFSGGPERLFHWYSLPLQKPVQAQAA